MECKPRYRQAGYNLRTQLLRIIKKAGLKYWPKLFQNLHSSRKTELSERRPEHVVCAWIGNSKAVARKHYLQIAEGHFERAAGIVNNNNEGKEKAAQNPTQQNAESCCTASHTVGEPVKFSTKRDIAIQCEGVVGGTGLEPVTPCV